MKYVLAVLIALAIAGTASAQNYYNNNQALENWYRLQDQRERNADRMREQQQWMEEQRERHQRDISRGQLW